MSLLHIMQFFDINLIIVHIRLGSNINLDYIAENDLEGKVEIIDSNILNEVKTLKNPCFSCSRKRRKLILEYADSVGVIKVLVAQHRNDIIETLLLNMILSREISTVNPLQQLFKGKFSIIRPFYLVDESFVIQRAKMDSC